MKKRFFLLVALFVFFAWSSYGQLSVGLVSGASLSKFKIGFVDDENEPYFSTKAVIGFHAGASINIPFSESIGIQTHIMFSQKGNKLEYVKTNSTTEVQNFQSNHNINYIEAPVLLKYKFGGETMGFSLMAGPNFSFALGGKLSERGNLEFYDSNSGEPFIGKVNENKSIKIGNKVNSNYRGFDAGFAFGFGSFFNVGETGQLILEARWAVGGSNILNPNYVNSPTYDKLVLDNTTGFYKANVSNNVILNNKEVVGEVRNRSFQFTVGYMFRFSDKY